MQKTNRVHSKKKILKMQQDHSRYAQVKNQDQKKPFMQYMRFTKMKLTMKLSN